MSTNITISNGPTVNINFYESINFGRAMEMTADITIGANVIPHTLGRKVTTLTAFYQNRLISLDWTNVDPDTDLESETNIYIPDSLAAYNDVTLYIL